MAKPKGCGSVPSPFRHAVIGKNEPQSSYRVMDMQNIAAIFPSVVLIASFGCSAAEGAAPNTDPPKSTAKTEWKLLSGLMLAQRSVDISFDRRLAVVCGQRVLDKASAKSCWLINLDSAEIEDLLSKCDEKAARIVGDPKERDSLRTESTC